MGIGSIGSSSFCMMRNQIQSFASGKQNIQKEDLEKIQSEIGGGQNQVGNMLSNLLESFDEIDSNGDGISVDELNSFSGNSEIEREQKAGKKLFSLFNDGESDAVTEEELLNMASEMESNGMHIPGKLQHVIASFDSFDTNGDGSLTKAEMADSMKSEKNGRMPPPPPPPKGVSEEELSGIASELEELGIEVPEELLSMIESFEELDTNSDGLLTRSEHEASIAGIEGTASKESLAITKADLENIATKIESAGGEVSNKLSSLLESFDSLDTNKDGQVTQEEMMAALKETKENTPEGGEKSDFLEQFGERFKEQKTNVPLRFFQEKMSAYSMFSQKAASNSTPEINLYQS